MLLGVLGGVWTVFQQPGWLAGVVLGAVLVIALVWLLTTTLWPSSADRSCPLCGKKSLKRIDPKTTRGLRCSACGYEDETASGWYLAEEEGALDEVVEASREGRSQAHRQAKR